MGRWIGPFTLWIFVAGLGYAIASSAAESDSSDGNSRPLHGGLGYEFAMTPDSARSLGFVDKSGAENEGRLIRLTQDFFLVQTLTFTPYTKKLVAIEGARPYTTPDHVSECNRDFSVVMGGLRQKYPALKDVRLVEPPPYYRFLCEGTNRPKGVVAAVVGDEMVGRCIHLTCLSNAQRSFLQIRYSDTDLSKVHAKESEELRRLRHEEILRERGIDPAKL